jgi:hypothetical protein
MKAYRWTVLAIAGAAAAASAYVLESSRSGASGPAPVASPTNPANPTAAAGKALGDFQRAPLAGPMYADPFGSRAPKRQPVPAPVVAAPPPPPPAPFPYKYAGTARNANGAVEAFLMRGTEVIAIKPGDLLDGQWRVEALTAERIEVTFVPASERRSLLLADLVADPAPSAPSAAQGTSVAAYEQPAAGRGVAQSTAAPSPASSIAGGIAGGRAVMAAAASAAPASAAAQSGSAVTAAASGASSTPLGSPTPSMNARLGSDAPTQGSMPLGAAPSGSFPRGATPTGKLGL